ncbi:MAG: isoprenylcysteine carboxylmethyltransferase family protein [Halanaeroarchaeum sp.]
MVALAPIVATVAAAAGIAIIATLVVTIRTDRRLWPPGDQPWKARFHWGLVAIFDLGLSFVAIRRWNTWILPRPGSLVVGLVLSTFGLAVFVHSARDMDPAETAGTAAERLYTEGPYARSRHPQYVGMIVGVLGFVALANAATVAVLGAVFVTWLLLLPLAEEPFLRERFGDDYDRYRERVPRYLGTESFRRRKSE